MFRVAARDLAEVGGDGRGNIQGGTKLVYLLGSWRRDHFGHVPGVAIVAGAEVVLRFPSFFQSSERKRRNDDRMQPLVLLFAAKFTQHPFVEIVQYLVEALQDEDDRSFARV